MAVVSLQCHTHSVSLNKSLYGTVVAAWLNMLCNSSPMDLNPSGLKCSIFERQLSLRYLFISPPETDRQIH